MAGRPGAYRLSRVCCLTQFFWRQAPRPPFSNAILLGKGRDSLAQICEKSIELNSSRIELNFYISVSPPHTLSNQLSKGPKFLRLLKLLFLFNTYSLESGNVWSFATRVKDKCIIFTQKVRESQGLIFLETRMSLLHAISSLAGPRFMCVLVSLAHAVCTYDIHGLSPDCAWARFVVMTRLCSILVHKQVRKLWCGKERNKIKQKRLLL